MHRSEAQTTLASTRATASARIEAQKQLSLSRLNHWLPRGQAHPEVVQGTAECHHPIADALLPQAEPIFHAAPALHTAVHILDPQPTLVQRLVRHGLLPRQRLPQIDIHSIAPFREPRQSCYRRVRRPQAPPLRQTFLAPLPYRSLIRACLSNTFTPVFTPLLRPLRPRVRTIRVSGYRRHGTSILQIGWTSGDG